jgi:hypothetical protein
MSDPVSNVEIEDVLSSIRRLVSEETGSKPRPEPLRQPSAENRLVLTPSLRVLDGVEKTTAPVDFDKEIQQVDEETPWRNPDATLYRAAQIEPEPESKPVSVDIEKPAGVVSSLAAENAEKISVEPSSNVLQQEDDQPSSVFVMKDIVRSAGADAMPEVDLDWGEVAETGGDTQSDDIQDAVESIDVEDILSNDVDLDVLTPFSAKIAALEAAIGERQDQWEPDGAPGDDYAGTTVQTLRWQDHEIDAPTSVANENNDRAAEQDTLYAAAANDDVDTSLDIDDDDDEATSDLFVGDDGIMDEDSLRELVADIVREELQGALGERITRNVRKLVRREIHRALTTQQLD